MNATGPSPEPADLDRILAVLGSRGRAWRTRRRTSIQCRRRASRPSRATWSGFIPPACDLGIYVHMSRSAATTAPSASTRRRIGADVASTSAATSTRLLRELEWVRPGNAPHPALRRRGGTPTALPPELLSRLLETIFQATTASRDRHVHTVEASPGDRSRSEHVAVLTDRGGSGASAWGFRASNDGVLDTVKRRHTRDDGRGELPAGSLEAGLHGQHRPDLRPARPDPRELAGRDVETVVGAWRPVDHGLQPARERAHARRPGPSPMTSGSIWPTWCAGAPPCWRPPASLGFEPKRWHTFQRRSGERPGRRDRPPTSTT